MPFVRVKAFFSTMLHNSILSTENVFRDFSTFTMNLDTKRKIANGCFGKVEGGNPVRVAGKAVQVWVL
jgi:hypothetical protein